MKPSIQDLRAKPGDNIYQKWQALLRWADQFHFAHGPGLQVRTSPDGVSYFVSRRTPWRHPFKVSRSGFSVRVRPGTCNALPVWMDTAYLDGYDEDRIPAPQPILFLDDVREDAQARYTYLMLYSRAQDGAERPEIRHVPAYDGLGQEIATIEWVENAPARVLQVALHNYTSSDRGTAREGDAYDVPAAGAGGTRIWYWPA